MRAGLVETEFGLQARRGGAPADRELREPGPVVMTDRRRRVEVEAHPHGGWTHAYLIGPGCAIFSGWWPTRRAALEALGK